MNKATSTNKVVSRYDECYDRAIRYTFFRLFTFLNDGAPEPKIAGKKINNRPFLYCMILVVHLSRAWDFSSGTKQFWFFLNQLLERSYAPTIEENSEKKVVHTSIVARVI